jgi:hypothetical protein
MLVESIAFIAALFVIAAANLGGLVYFAPSRNSKMPSTASSTRQAVILRNAIFRLLVDRI